jgi:hypothetical protein
MNSGEEKKPSSVFETSSSAEQLSDSKRRKQNSDIDQISSYIKWKQSIIVSGF